MRLMAHAHLGVPCAHPTKKACELARRAELGQCSEMIEAKGEPYPCTHWAIDRIAGRGYCGQHIAAVARAEDETIRRNKVREEMNAHIDRYIAWREIHPSLHDRMPLDWMPS